MVKLKDSLSRQLVDVANDEAVTVYSCGPTVYDYPHIGNWYSFLRWDLLIRTLETSGYKTNWVMNITDVGHLVGDGDSGQDKLVAKAREQSKTAWEVAEFYTSYFISSLKKLNFRPIDTMPKATEHIAEQIELVEVLVAAGVTYQLDDGIYFDTSKLSDYGKLVGKLTGADKQQARIEGIQGKKQASDFALWKFSPTDTKRDMEWPSLWGVGFPGWHIECSAMSRRYLGQPLGIHTGGIDHIPIHHTNEIAQSETAYKQPLAKIWLHSNFITVNGQKMSKSLNNFFTLEDIEAKGYKPKELRLATLASHYATAADFSWQLLHDAQQRLKRWQTLAAQRFQINAQLMTDSEASELITDSHNKVLSSLKQDLNSPEALRHIDDVADAVANLPNGLAKTCQQPFVGLLKRLDDLFGLNLMELPDISGHQRQLLNKRAEARNQHDYQTSDKLRQTLAAEGIAVKDKESGQAWTYTSTI